MYLFYHFDLFYFFCSVFGKKVFQNLFFHPDIDQSCFTEYRILQIWMKYSKFVFEIFLLLPIYP